MNTKYGVLQAQEKEPNRTLPLCLYYGIVCHLYFNGDLDFTCCYLPKCGFLFVIEYLIGHIKYWLLQVSLPSVLSSGYSHISCSICTVSRTSVEQVRIGGSHCSLQCCYRTHQVRHRSFQKVGERELKRNTKT